MTIALDLSQMTLDDLANWAGARANEFRREGFHCSESVLRAVALAIGVDLSDEMLRVSTGFRGGGGGYGDRCGALNSGAMMISYLYGRTRPTEDSTYVSELTNLLHKRFDDELGATRCSLLLKCYSKQVPDGSCSIVFAAGARLAVQVLGQGNGSCSAGTPPSFVARLKPS